jgi:glycosyltransferase involved in cell wall biosynthesis
MNKALLISYRFPPQGGGGVQRTLKYTKYLRDFGWEPVVQTAKDPFWPVWDDTLLAEIPDGVRVYRAPAFEFERLEHRLAALVGGAAGGANGAGTGTPSRVQRGGGERSRGRARGGGIAGAVRRAIHRRVLIPDPQIAWVPGAFVQALGIARREGVRILYTSAPPNSVHLLGGLLAGTLRLPWVADFRDPWTDGPRRQRSYAGNRMRAGIERAAERWVIQRARRIVVSAAPLRDRFLHKYAFLDPAHVHVLTNGYDPADFAAADQGERVLEPGRFHLTGTGNIEAMFDARPLLEAIAAAVAEDPGLRAELLVTLVGARRGRHDADIAALGLADRVRYPGWVPHAKSLKYLCESDVLLMCQLPHAGGGAEKLSGKCFEYLYLRKPVLCLTVPGLTADLLAESGLGTVVHPADTGGIKTALETLYAQRRERLCGNADVIARFDRRHLTGRLAAIFDDVAGAPAAASRAA